MALSWIGYLEKVVGRGHPTLADVANRPLRELLTQSGYDPDGTFAGFVKVTRASVTFSATPTYSFASGVTVVRVGDLTANMTSQTWTGAIDGQFITMVYRQDGTGSRTVAAPTNAVGFGTVSATASSISSQTFVFDSGLAKFIATGPMITGM